MMLLNNKISRFHISWYRTVDSYLDHVHNVRKVMDNKCLVGSTHTRSLHHMSTHHGGSGKANLYFRVSSMSADFGRSTPYPSTLCRRFGDSVRREYSISRDRLAQLWLKEKRKVSVKRKRKPATVRRVSVEDAVSETSSFQMPFLKSLLSRVVPNGYEIQANKTHELPPVGQYAGSSLSQSSTKKVQLESLLARANLLITRDIEWANIMFAIEQESRFVIMDPLSQSPVGSIREQSNLIYRQLLRTRRPFVAHITDAIGNEIFKIRRPFWLINSSIYVEVDGKEIGVVHRRWHLWRRIYDLYLGNKQFAVVENPGFWNWTFTLKDDTNNVLGQIDRDWRGFGFELLTDAGQYVIRFGGNDLRPKYDSVPVIEDLEVARPLTLPERAVTVALAVSLDNDYFSRHGGLGLPIFIAGE